MDGWSRLCAPCNRYRDRAVGLGYIFGALPAVSPPRATSFYVKIPSTD